ncbi:hypothetical protein [Methanoregula sp.]|uniref:hypothetical protein n=1 Tax=Methanoregula sp. TaxID=2052170 RepID=UPI003BAFFDBA
MKKNTLIILLISLIAIIFVAIYFGMPGSTAPLSSHPIPVSAQTGPVVEIVDTAVRYSSLGTPYFYGTVKSNTAVPVTAVIGAGIYDESGRMQLAGGYSNVSITPYGQAQYTVPVFNLHNLPENWEYRVYVEDVY